MDLTLAVFLLVYLAMAIGFLPGFKVDRTGAAVVGAMLLIAVGRISPPAAWAAIDYRTLGLLFGLMVISSAFVTAGFYNWTARRVAGLPVGPAALLAVLIAVGGGLSALLTNDVVMVAMTPVLVSITLARGLNPVPFLLAFCFAANVGSAATIIGSPQNMIAAEALRISFTGFVRVAALPALAGLPVIWLVIVLLYRGRWTAAAAPAAPAAASPAASPGIAFDRLETLKAAFVTLLVLGAFVFSSWPHMLVAMAGASALLVSRSTASRDMLAHVDGNLLLLLMGLFVVNAALASTDLPQHLLAAMRQRGLDLHDPLSLLVVMSVLSNIVGNNPAVMLVVPFIGEVGPESADGLGAAIALGTGFSSNLVIFGSLAGIIVAEQARDHGVRIGFAEFSRAGLPTAVLTLGLAAAWIVAIA